MKTMLLETEDLCKYYGSGENLVKAIDHTTMDIQRGEFTAIVGRSTCWALWTARTAERYG